MSLADLLIERGWIQPADRVHIDYLLERKLKKYGGDARATLASVSNEVKRSLAALDDADIQRSLADLPRSGESDSGATIDYVPGLRERYALAHLHATGGIGRVWVARDSQLGRDVALKELRPDRAGNAALWERFLREAQITGQLEHPGIVPVYELSRRPDDDQPFYTMRLIKGRTLTEAVRDYHQERQRGHADSLGFLVLLNAFVTVCNTCGLRPLAGRHSPRSERPERGPGRFRGGHRPGLGPRQAGGVPQEDEPNAPPVVFDVPGSGDANLTIAGQTLGTPSYMAPEQAAGRVELIDPRTDVYGLGAILYEILTGQPPFSGSEILDVLRRVQEEQPIPPMRLNPDVPPALQSSAFERWPRSRPIDMHRPAISPSKCSSGKTCNGRQAEDALRQQTRILHSILDSMADGVVVADRDGRFMLFNPAAERMPSASD